MTDEELTRLEAFIAIGLSDKRIGSEARTALPALIAEVRRLRAIIAMIDQHAPPADESCDQPGITLSEAAWRMIQEVQP